MSSSKAIAKLYDSQSVGHTTHTRLVLGTLTIGISLPSLRVSLGISAICLGATPRFPAAPKDSGLYLAVVEFTRCGVEVRYKRIEEETGKRLRQADDVKPKRMTVPFNPSYYFAIIKITILVCVSASLLILPRQGTPCLARLLFNMVLRSIRLLIIPVRDVVCVDRL